MENIFAEHKQELKQIALSNKKISFGENQPSLNSAYRAIIGFVLFLVFSIVLVLFGDFISSEFESKEFSQIPYLNYFTVFFSFLILLCLTVLVCYAFLVRNFRETIYIKHLDFSLPCLPYGQLLLSFFTILLLEKIDHIILLNFFIHLFTILLILFLIYKLSRTVLSKNAYHNRTLTNDLDAANVNKLELNAEIYKI